MSRQQAEKLEDPSQAYTRLMDKHYSPMVIRKTTKLGFPIFVALITDDPLDDLDDRILEFIRSNAVEGWSSNVQKVRNFAGAFVEFLNSTYEKTEGSAVIVYADKCLVNSLHGDLMTHLSCKVELFGSLNFMTLV
jgi:hypothetical protein